MGTCHILMHPEFICKLVELYPKQIRIMEMNEFGDGLVNCRVQSNKLPNGYHGQMELAVIDGQLVFKRDFDT